MIARICQREPNTVRKTNGQHLSGIAMGEQDDIHLPFPGNANAAMISLFTSLLLSTTTKTDSAAW